MDVDPPTSRQETSSFIVDSGSWLFPYPRFTQNDQRSRMFTTVHVSCDKRSPMRHPGRKGTNDLETLHPLVPSCRQKTGETNDLVKPNSHNLFLSLNHEKGGTSRVGQLRLEYQMNFHMCLQLEIESIAIRLPLKVNVRRLRRL